MSPLRGIASHAWSVVCWIVLSGLVAAAFAALFYYQRVDDELTRFVQKKMTEAYPNLTVNVGGARYVQGEGVQIHQVSWVRPGQTETNAPSELAYVESIAIGFESSLAAMAQGDIVVDRVAIRGLAVELQASASGQLDFSSLVPENLPIPRSKKLPQVSFEKTTVRIRDVRDGPARSLEMEDIDLRLRLKRIANNRLSRQPAPIPIANGVATAGLQRLPSDPQEAESEPYAGVLVAYEGQLQTSCCHRVEFEGVARTTDGAWTLQSTLDDVDISSQTISRLPRFLADRITTQSMFRGRASFRLNARKTDRDSSPTFTIGGHLAGGMWQDPQWSQALSNLNFDFKATETGIDIHKLSGRCGEASLTGNIVTAGYVPNSSPFQLSLQFTQLPVTQRLVRSLPPAIQSEWQKLRATGVLSGQLDCRFEDGKFTYDSKFTCEETSLEHYRFPYRLSDCHGTVSLTSELCKFQLKGMAGEAPIEMSGSLENPGAGYTGSWKVTLNDWKSIDEALVAAMPDEAQKLVRELELRGKIGCYVRGIRSKPYQPERPQIIVAVDRGWINYKNFPYPISGVSGRIESTERGWKFSQLEGWNDGCHIKCEGRWDNHAPERELDLEFQLADIRLDEELRQALPPGAKQSWSQLRPRGLLDRATVNLYRSSADPELGVDIEVVHRPEKIAGQVSNAIHIHPLWFPLPMNNVRGEAYFSNESISLRSVTAEYGKTMFRTNGKGSIKRDGRWRMNLTECAVDRIELREPVLNALPRQLARSLRQIKLDGMFSLAGAMHFVQEEALGPMTAGWDLALNIERGELVAATPMTGIFGEVRFSGASHGTRAWSRGELRLDSLMTKGVQLTNVTGPIWIDSSRMILGQRVPQVSVNQVTAPVSANIYRGRLTTNSEVAFQTDLPFRVEVSLTNLDMATLGRDMRIGEGNLAGRGQFDLTLTGTTAGRHTYRGAGQAQRLRDATMYELPLILTVLNRISSGRRDNTAFTSSDVEFRVEDGFVYFDRFDLAGDTITLKGLGEMSLDRQISLDFYTIMGREQLWSPIVRPFLGQASRQFLQIHVNGPLDNPRATQEVLPGINETLRQLFPEQTAVPEQASRPRLSSPLGR